MNILTRIFSAFCLWGLRACGHTVKLAHRDQQGRFTTKEPPPPSPLEPLGITPRQISQSTPLELPEDDTDLAALALTLRRWVLRNMDHWVNGRGRSVAPVFDTLLKTWSLGVVREVQRGLRTPEGYPLRNGVPVRSEVKGNYWIAYPASGPPPTAPPPVPAPNMHSAADGTWSERFQRVTDLDLNLDNSLAAAPAPATAWQPLDHTELFTPDVAARPRAATAASCARPSVAQRSSAQHFATDATQGAERPCHSSNPNLCDLPFFSRAVSTNAQQSDGGTDAAATNSSDSSLPTQLDFSVLEVVRPWPPAPEALQGGHGDPPLRADSLAAGADGFDMRKIQAEIDALLAPINAAYAARQAAPNENASQWPQAPADLDLNLDNSLVASPTSATAWQSLERTELFTPEGSAQRGTYASRGPEVPRHSSNPGLCDLPSFSRAVSTNAQQSDGGTAAAATDSVELTLLSPPEPAPPHTLPAAGVVREGQGPERTAILKEVSGPPPAEALPSSGGSHRPGFNELQGRSAPCEAYVPQPDRLPPSEGGVDNSLPDPAWRRGVVAVDPTPRAATPPVRVRQYDPHYDVVAGLPRAVKDAESDGYRQGFGSDPQAAREHYYRRNRALFGAAWATYGVGCTVYAEYDSAGRPYCVARADGLADRSAQEAELGWGEAATASASPQRRSPPGPSSGRAPPVPATG